MAAAAKGVFWRDEEVETLLDLVARSGKAARVMRSTHLPTKLIFHKLSRQMCARGHSRTPEQCRSKFKRVKGDFYGALEAWQGIPRQSGKPPYFASMMNLWDLAGRPSWQSRHHAALLRGRAPTAAVGEERADEEQEALEVAGEQASSEDPVQGSEQAPPASAQESQLERSEEGPSTSRRSAPPGRAQRRGIGDLFTAMERMEERLGSSISNVQERLSSVEDRLARLGRRVNVMERRERRRHRPSASGDAP